MDKNIYCSNGQLLFIVGIVALIVFILVTIIQSRSKKIIPLPIPIPPSPIPIPPSPNPPPPNNIILPPQNPRFIAQPDGYWELFWDPPQNLPPTDFVYGYSFSPVAPFTGSSGQSTTTNTSVIFQQNQLPSLAKYTFQVWLQNIFGQSPPVVLTTKLFPILKNVINLTKVGDSSFALGLNFSPSATPETMSNISLFQSNLIIISNPQQGCTTTSFPSTSVTYCSGSNLLSNNQRVENFANNSNKFSMFASNPIINSETSDRNYCQDFATSGFILIFNLPSGCFFNGVNVGGYIAATYPGESGPINILEYSYSISGSPPNGQVSNLNFAWTPLNQNYF